MTTSNSPEQFSKRLNSVVRLLFAMFVACAAWIPFNVLFQNDVIVTFSEENISFWVVT